MSLLESFWDYYFVSYIPVICYNRNFLRGVSEKFQLEKAIGFQSFGIKSIMILYILSWLTLERPIFFSKFIGYKNRLKKSTKLSIQFKFAWNNFAWETTKNGLLEKSLVWRVDLNKWISEEIFLCKLLMGNVAKH